MHVHVPAGAVPKDGPSAGVAMAVALSSLVCRQAACVGRRDDGRDHAHRQVLPIGGVKEKVLAAQRAGISRVILPKRNEGDVAEIPEHERGELEFVYVERIPQALDAAL